MACRHLIALILPPGYVFGSQNNRCAWQVWWVTPPGWLLGGAPFLGAPVHLCHLARHRDTWCVHFARPRANPHSCRAVFRWQCRPVGCQIGFLRAASSTRYNVGVCQKFRCEIVGFWACRFLQCLGHRSAVQMRDRLVRATTIVDVARNAIIDGLIDSKSEAQVPVASLLCRLLPFDYQRRIQGTCRPSVSQRSMAA
jgi:hypothetical protein